MPHVVARKSSSAVAVLAVLVAGTVIGSTTQHSVSADISVGSRPVLVPIEPCRLADTRPADNVGPRNTPLGAAETETFDALDPTTECGGLIPDEALAVSMNITALGATQQSFLTVWPDGPRPLAASLNPAPGEPPTPNAVTTKLAASGAFSIYNNAGSVHVVIDVNGYYENHTHDDRYYTEAEVDAFIASNPGPAGPPGPVGPSNRFTAEQIARRAWFEDPNPPAVFEVSTQPIGMAFDGQTVYVGTQAEDLINTIDVASGVVGTIGLPSSASDVMFDGSRVYASLCGSNQVVVIDPATHDVVGSPIGVGGCPVTSYAAAGRIFVGNNIDSTLSVIDPATQSVIGSAIPLGGAPRAIAYNGLHLYILTPGSVVVLDPNTLATVDTIAVSGSVSDILFAHGLVWAVIGSSVQVIDPQTNAVVGSPIAIPSQTRALEYDGSHIYVTSTTTGVHTIDPLSRQVVGDPILVDGSPFDLVYDGTYMYSANIIGNTVSRFLPR